MIFSKEPCFLLVENHILKPRSKLQMTLFLLGIIASRSFQPSEFIKYI